MGENMLLCRDRCRQENLIIKPKQFTMIYKEGIARCSVCEVYMAHTQLRCLCCSNKLRVSPRSNTAKKKWRVKMKALKKNHNLLKEKEIYEDWFKAHVEMKKVSFKNEKAPEEFSERKNIERVQKEKPWKT